MCTCAQARSYTRAGRTSAAEKMSTAANDRNPRAQPFRPISCHARWQTQNNETSGATNARSSPDTPDTSVTVDKIASKITIIPYVSSKCIILALLYKFFFFCKKSDS